MVERILRKRFLRFSLRTLLLLMLVFGIWLGLKHLRGKTELTSLWVGLGDNQITDEGLQHLRGLSNLQQLGVQSVQASPEAGDELQATLPGCRVMFSHRSDLPHDNPYCRD